jgi:hypothetical protein
MIGVLTQNVHAFFYIISHMEKQDQTLLVASGSSIGLVKSKTIKFLFRKLSIILNAFLDHPYIDAQFYIYFSILHIFSQPSPQNKSV